MAELKIKADSGGGTVSFKGPATTTSNAAVQLTLPVDDGTTGQYLKTDGSGALSWATVDTSIADDSIVEAKLDVSNAPTNGQFLQAQSGEGGGLTWAAACNWTDKAEVSLSGANTASFTGLPSNIKLALLTWRDMRHTNNIGTSSDYGVRFGHSSTTWITSGYGDSQGMHYASTSSGGTASNDVMCRINLGGTSNGDVSNGHMLLFPSSTQERWYWQTVAKKEGNSRFSYVYGFINMGSGNTLTGIQLLTVYNANNFDDGAANLHFLTA